MAAGRRGPLRRSAQLSLRARIRWDGGEFCGLKASAGLRNIRGMASVSSADISGHRKTAFKRIDHHYAHALSAYPVSGFDEATVVVIDGRGAWEATSIWHGKGGELKLIDMVRWPNSIGLFYAQFTGWLGFERFQDEWKVMGLAPYGGPGIDLKVSSASPTDIIRSTHGCFLRTRLPASRRCSARRRKPDEPLSDRHRDVAWAVQDACERAELAVIKRAVSLTGSRNLCLAGGVALNSKANGLILSRKLVDRIFIQPAATDDGVAIGAALSAPVAAGFRCRRDDEGLSRARNRRLTRSRLPCAPTSLAINGWTIPPRRQRICLRGENSLDGTRAGKSLAQSARQPFHPC